MPPVRMQAQEGTLFQLTCHFPDQPVPLAVDIVLRLEQGATLPVALGFQDAGLFPDVQLFFQ